MLARGVVLIGMLLSSLGAGSAIASAQDGYPGSPHSISLGPDWATASPGETVSYTVTVRTMETGLRGFSGAVLVTVPSGLSVVGSPLCETGCGLPAVAAGPTGTTIEASIDIYADETASLSFQVTIEPTAPVGTAYQLVAYLLGGVNTAGSSETAFATLNVGEGGIAAGPEDNREAWLDVTPLALRSAPGGSTLYFVQPAFWGMWGETLPEHTVELRLPAGMRLIGEPICGPRQSSMPAESSCEVTVEASTDGGSLVTARPESGAGTSSGVYAVVEIDMGLTAGTVLHVDAALSVEGEVPVAAQNAAQSVTVLVVAPGEVSAEDASGAVSGLVELQANFARQADTCGSDAMAEGTELALYEWGGESMFASTVVSQGRIAEASDGSGREVCILPFSFEGAPKRSIYMVSLMPYGSDPPCRACVLGLLTPSERADQVLMWQ